MPITRSSPGKPFIYTSFFDCVCNLHRNMHWEMQCILAIKLRSFWCVCVCVFSLFIFTFTSTGKVTFRWKSYATIYAMFFYIAMTVVVYYVGLERIRILGETKKFDEKIYAYIFVIFLVPHFWIPFVGWGKVFSFLLRFHLIRRENRLTVRRETCATAQVDTWFEFDLVCSCSQFMWNSWKSKSHHTSPGVLLSHFLHVARCFSSSSVFFCSLFILHMSLCLILLECLCVMCNFLLIFIVTSFRTNRTYTTIRRCGQRSGRIQNRLGFISGKRNFYIFSPIHSHRWLAVSYFICLHFSCMRAHAWYFLICALFFCWLKCIH